jgi:type IV pilus assembly protein PilP
MKPWGVLLVLVGPLLLAGCGNEDMNEVREFVRTAHADRKPKVEPLPEIKTQDSFAYSAANLADPFAVFNLKPIAGGGGAGSGVAGPDPNRRREPLEEYPLDSLKMVGTIARGKQAWAIIQAPDGSVHRAKTGDHMGQSSGLITKVSDEKVDLIELIQGPLGDWVEREASLSLLD